MLRDLVFLLNEFILQISSSAKRLCFLEIIKESYDVIMFYI